ncbi:MAG: discoidin domain-containing protein [Oscillospiraceae bacterium]|nr:discoidin domain-containing protein [Oscillospiraceae bacterium]
MNKILNKFIAVLLSLAMLPAVSLSALAADNVSVVNLDPSNALTFNDGKFEGWGTSLCWWANRVGYDETLTQKAAELFYSDEGLSLDIARYNVGGGDNPEHDHITRSDSKVPGYAVGYDNDGNIIYDWSADKNQRNVALAAKKANPDVYFEGFSNSAPYFMTNSGCTSGAINASYDNLCSTEYDDFAEYIATVTEHFKNEWGIEFKSYSPMNEPYTNYWGVNSPKQEGCHFQIGYSESKMINELRFRLNQHGLKDVLVAGSDETSIDTTITCIKQLSYQALHNLGRIDTHTYGGSKRAELRALAESLGKDLWMSEVDGSYTAGEEAGYMSAGLGLSQQIIKDMNGLMPSAWVMWDIIDSHKDNTSPYRTEGEKETAISQTGGIWGIAMADHDTKDVVLTKKYYAYGQFTKYIEPGMTIIGSSDKSLAAYDRESGRIVIVAINTSASDKDYIFNLSNMPVSGYSARVIRTSGDLETGENWAELEPISVQNRQLSTSLKGNSVTTFIIDAASELENIAEDLAPDTEIYTDQYMPAEYKGAYITWKPSIDAVLPDGKVTRGERDIDMSITAEFSKDGQTITREYGCNVKAKPDNKDEKDMEAYLFVHFAGTEKTGDEEQIYFSVSKDGQTWRTLNNRQPILKSTMGEKGVRDPHIVRSPEGDKFFLIATDLSIFNRAYDPGRWGTCQRSGSKSIMIWESTDLVHWSNQRMAQIAPDNAGCAWAPESVYDSEKGAYMVFWASKVSDDNYSTQRIYRCYTKDFEHFTAPELYIDDGTVSNIDTTFIKDNGTYYRFTKNESNSSVTMMRSNSLDNSFADVDTYTINGEAGNMVTGYEGPTVYKLNGENKWCLLLDFYSQSGGYKPFVTDDIATGNFVSADDFNFDMKYRHGTVIPITLDEYNALVKEYATTEFVGADRVKVGTSSKYVLMVNGEESSPEWSVSDEDIAEISTDGTLSAKALGTVTVSAYVPEYGVTDSMEVEISKYSEIELTKSMTSGSVAWENGTVNTYEKTVDNDLTTFFDGIEDGYLTIDLGKQYNVQAVGYAPRKGFAYRMKDAYFEGSADGNKWNKLYTIPDIPEQEVITTAEIKPGEYRYIRYAVPSGTHNYNPSNGDAQGYCCNIAEIKLYGDAIEDIDDGLALHITFDEDNTSSGAFEAKMGGKVKENGDMTYEQGVNGNALSIKYGVDNYLELPKGILDGASSASVSFWFKQGDSGKDGWTFMTTPVADSQVYKSEKYLGLLMSKSMNKITAERYFSENQERPAQAEASNDFTEWRYVTVVYEPDYTSIYIDGELQTRISSPASLKELFTADAISWIGHANWGSGEGLEGLMDDFRLYSRTLTENEIMELFTAQNNIAFYPEK